MDVDTVYQMVLIEPLMLCLLEKKVLVFGYGDVGKGCAASMKSANSIVHVAEVDPICAL